MWSGSGRMTGTRSSARFPSSAGPLSAFELRVEDPEVRCRMSAPPPERCMGTLIGLRTSHQFQGPHTAVPSGGLAPGCGLRQCVPSHTQPTPREDTMDRMTMLQCTGPVNHYVGRGVAVYTRRAGEAWVAWGRRAASGTGPLAVAKAWAGKERLKSEYNRPGDTDTGPQEASIMLDPGSQGEDAAIGRLLEADANYAGKERSEFYPDQGFMSKFLGNGYNSNSYSAGLLRAAGIPALGCSGSSSSGYYVPGFRKPIPTDKFR